MSQASGTETSRPPQGWKVWWRAMRPKTLPAALAPVLLGQTLAWAHAHAGLGWFDWPLAGMILLCAVLLQVAVNFANDVFDYQAGVDGAGRLGPKRVVAQGWLKPWQLKLGLVVVLALALVCGSYLVWYGGWLYLGLGVASLLALLAYSAGPWPLASHALGEATVFVFFGLVAVAGGYHLQQGQLPAVVWVAATQMGLLTAAIMLVNNVRDLSSDAAAGKHTLAVKLGELRAEGLYRWLLLVPVALQWLVVEWTLPDGDLTLAQRLLSTGLWVWVVAQAVRLSYLIAVRRGTSLNTQLAQTAALTLAFAVAAAVELVVRHAS